MHLIYKKASSCFLVHIFDRQAFLIAIKKTDFKIKKTLMYIQII